MEKEGEILEAVLVENGRIKSAGDFEKVKLLVKEDAQWINLEGKTLMPAFIDAHSHISTAIQMSQAADLSQCESFEEIISVLREYQKEQQIGKSGVIIGFGYDHNFLPEGKQPDKRYLNQVSKEIPIYISHASGHMGCANDAALALAGITKDTPNPDGGKIGRTGADGEPDGYLEEAAMMLLQKAIGPRIKFDLNAGLKKTQELYLQNGIVTVQDGAASPESFAMLRQMDESKELILDVVLYPLLQNQARELFLEFPEYAEQYHGNLKLGGYKAVLDGSPQGRSAWLTKPYENSDGYCAYPWFSDEETEKFMKTAVEDSRQILVHCNGDAAGDQFIHAYKKALENSKNPEKRQASSGDDSLSDSKRRPVRGNERTGYSSVYFCGTCILLGRSTQKKFRRRKSRAYQSLSFRISKKYESDFSSGYAGYETGYAALCMVWSQPHDTCRKSVGQGAVLYGL